MRVREEVTSSSKTKHRAHRLYYSRAVFILSACALLYYLLLTQVSGWWWALCVAGFSLSLASAGMAVQHTANHGGLPHKWAQFVFGYVIDFIGGSRYVWREQHNKTHHSVTNVVGADHDIDKLPFLRFAEEQEWKWYYRFQFIYAFFLYGFMVIVWPFGDFRAVITGRMGDVRIKRPTSKELLGFAIFKLVFVGWAIALPLTRHGWQDVLGTYLAVAWLTGFILAVVFQLAHVVEGSNFESKSTTPNVYWTRNQVETTLDFFLEWRWLHWLFTNLVGGLNYQTEHHIGQNLTDTLLPRVAPILKEVAEKHGVRYRRVHLREAIWMHILWLYKMGRRPATSNA